MNQTITFQVNIHRLRYLIHVFRTIDPFITSTWYLRNFFTWYTEISLFGNFFRLKSCPLIGNIQPEGTIWTGIKDCKKPKNNRRRVYGWKFFAVSWKRDKKPLMFVGQKERHTPAGLLSGIPQLGRRDDNSNSSDCHWRFHLLPTNKEARDWQTPLCSQPIKFSLCVIIESDGCRSWDFCFKCPVKINPFSFYYYFIKSKWGK